MCDNQVLVFSLDIFANHEPTYDSWLVKFLLRSFYAQAAMLNCVDVWRSISLQKVSAGPLIHMVTYAQAEYEDVHAGCKQNSQLLRPPWT